MSELNQNEVSRLQSIIYLIPTTFVQESAGTASCHGTVFYRYFVQIELVGDYASPTPHTIFVFILISDRTVSDGKQYRTSIFTAGTCYSIFLNGL